MVGPVAWLRNRSVGPRPEFAVRRDSRWAGSGPAVNARKFRFGIAGRASTRAAWQDFARGWHQPGRDPPCGYLSVRGGVRSYTNLPAISYRILTIRPLRG